MPIVLDMMAQKQDILERVKVFLTDSGTTMILIVCRNERHVWYEIDDVDEFPDTYPVTPDLPAPIPDEYTVVGLPRSTIIHMIGTIADKFEQLFATSKLFGRDNIKPLLYDADLWENMVDVDYDARLARNCLYMAQEIRAILRECE